MQIGKVFQARFMRRVSNMWNAIQTDMMFDYCDNLFNIHSTWPKLDFYT